MQPRRKLAPSVAGLMIPWTAFLLGAGCARAKTDAMDVDTQGDDGDASPTDDADVADDATGVGDVDAPTDANTPAPKPGSLAACALIYEGFDTCCAYDKKKDVWVLLDEPCYKAEQCTLEADCPAGFIERLSMKGICECWPARHGTCNDHASHYPAPDGTCPVGTNRCPYVYPENGKAMCTPCECTDVWTVPTLAGALYCPPEQDRPLCPCDGSVKDCCVGTSGNGMACSQGKWSPYADGDCYPPTRREGHEMPPFCANNLWQ